MIAVYKKLNTLAYIFIFMSLLAACRPEIKEQQDKIYSRHLQRHVKLEVISTTIPDKKVNMNLLLINSAELLKQVDAVKVLDSLNDKKQILPLMLVAFDGKKEQYGLTHTGNQTTDAKNYKKFSEFITRELYPFIKKKAGIREFKTVAICGFGLSANNAFHIACHNDDLIQKAGLFYPTFEKGQLDMWGYSKNFPVTDLLIVTTREDSTTQDFVNLHNSKPAITNSFVYAAPVAYKDQDMPAPETFAKFLVWAFGKN